MSADLGAVRYPVPGWEASGRWPHPSKWTWAHWEHWLRGGRYTEATIAAYRVLREYWGVSTQPRDKRGRVIEGSPKTWLYLPTPLGVLYHQSTLPYLLFGGARGGTKSHSKRWDAIRRCLAEPGYRAILFRRLHEELKLTHVDRLRQEIPKVTQGKGWIVGDDEVWFPHPDGNDALLKMGHCKDEGDEQKYLGSEWDWIGVDQAEMFTWRQLVDIMGSGRTAKEGYTSFFRASANPGGADPQQLIEHFIDKTVPREEAERTNYAPAEWGYIRARVYDNPYLMDADGSFRRYEARLAQYDPVRRRQMLEGDWSAREGQFFREFGAAHLASASDLALIA